MLWRLAVGCVRPLPFALAAAPAFCLAAAVDVRVRFRHLRAGPREDARGATSVRDTGASPQGRLESELALG